MRNIVATLSLAGVLVAVSQNAGAAFVYPTSAVSQGLSFGTGYEANNLFNSGFTSATNLIDAGTIQMQYNGYASISGYPFPYTITLNFTNPHDLDTFYLWNAVHAGALISTQRGFDNFSLRFYDGDGSQIGATFVGAAVKSPTSGTFAAQQFPLGSTYMDVKSVELVIASTEAGAGWSGAHEVAFEGEEVITPPPVIASPDRVIVYLLGGQSNGDGYGNPAELSDELATPQNDIDFYHSNPGGNSSLTANSWIALQPGSGSMPANANYFGPELGFGIDIHEMFGSEGARIAVVKHALGGSSLYADWFPGGDGTPSGDGPVYQDFQSTVGSALASLAIRYPAAIIQLEGMVWVQGEADAIVSSETANAYEGNLADFVADIRSTYGSGLRFGIVQLSDNQPIDSTRLATVKLAQATVAAADPLNYLVTTGDLPTRPGNEIHFGTTSVLTIGSRLATGMVQVPLTDADGNGLDDLWEVSHWGATGQDPNADLPDQDGLSNLWEFNWLADPFVSDAPELGIQAGPALWWLSTTERRYYIETSTNLVHWTRKDSFILGVDGTNSYPLDLMIEGDSRFYRIGVQR